MYAHSLNIGKTNNLKVYVSNKAKDCVRLIDLSFYKSHYFGTHFEQYFTYIVVVSFISGGNRGSGENHRPAANH
jgi:hypothetical protein